MKKPIYQVSFKIVTNARIKIQRGSITVTVTQCNIRRTDTDTVLGIGKAYCSPSDVFDINTGRKLALKRVMKKLHFPKALRTKIWKAMQAGTIYISG